METFLFVVIFILAAGAFLYAWITRQEISRVNRRLDRYNRALFDANDEIRRLQEDLSNQVAQLRGEIARSSGKMMFTPQMSVREIQAMHPQAQEILAGFHLGGCSSCAVDSNDRLDDICRNSGVDVMQVVQNLNLLAGGHDKPANGVERVKLPNIELSL